VVPWYVHRRYRHSAEEPLAGLVSVGGPFEWREDAEWMRARWPRTAPPNTSYIDDKAFPEPVGKPGRVWVVAATDAQLEERFPGYVFKVGPFASRRQGRRWIDAASAAIVEAVPWMFAPDGRWTVVLEADLRTGG
jgi:hypothetical protein